MDNDEKCTYRVSVKGIAIDDSGRFLLSKEENGMWEMLGGGLGHDEDPIGALKREILEETGLVAEVVSPTPLYFLTSLRHDRQDYTANIIYEIKLKDLNFTASDECVELRYFSVEEAKQEKLFPNVKKLLEIYKA